MLRNDIGNSDILTTGGSSNDIGSCLYAIRDYIVDTAFESGNTVDRDLGSTGTSDLSTHLVQHR